MTADKPDNASSSSSSSSSDPSADLAQAYRDLARGEQAATALEANLSNLESKLDAMLAAFESQEGRSAGAGSDDKKAGDSQTKSPADEKS